MGYLSLDEAGGAGGSHAGDGPRGGRVEPRYGGLRLSGVLRVLDHRVDVLRETRGQGGGERETETG